MQIKAVFLLHCLATAQAAFINATTSDSDSDLVANKKLVSDITMSSSIFSVPEFTNGSALAHATIPEGISNKAVAKKSGKKPLKFLVKLPNGDLSPLNSYMAHFERDGEQRSLIVSFGATGLKEAFFKTSDYGRVEYGFGSKNADLLTLSGNKNLMRQLLSQGYISRDQVSLSPLNDRTGYLTLGGLNDISGNYTATYTFPIDNSTVSSSLEARYVPKEYPVLFKNKVNLKLAPEIGYSVFPEKVAEKLAYNWGGALSVGSDRMVVKCDNTESAKEPIFCFRKDYNYNEFCVSKADLQTKVNDDICQLQVVAAKDSHDVVLGNGILRNYFVNVDYERGELVMKHN